ncbi:hypothetical protein OAL43_02700, partial [bacterium]|nr:hypothetical protein [bacterium]
ATSLPSSAETGQVGIGKIGNVSNICPVQPFSHRVLLGGMRPFRGSPGYRGGYVGAIVGTFWHS